MLCDWDMLDVFGKRFLAALHAREAQCATSGIYHKISKGLIQAYIPPIGAGWDKV